MEAQERRGRAVSEAALTTAFGRHLADLEVENGKGAFKRAAAALSTSKVYVSQIARGEKTPSAKLMWAIEQWSGGAVTMQSWFQEEE